MDKFLAEQWKGITGYPDYEVSTHGRVRRITDGHLLKAGSLIAISATQDGYRRVTIGNAKIFRVAQLVLETFIGPRPEGCETHHKDEDQSNDWLYNLEYLSINEHHFKHKKKLSDEDIIRICVLRAKGISVRVIAKEYNISTGFISNITAGRRRTKQWGN